MKFKSIASPKPAKGMVTGKKQVVPDQNMSLEEIISRFTRGEALAIGRETSFDDGDDDLEKVKQMDLVDREEYVNKLKNTQKEYSKQEKAKATAHAKKLREEALAKIEAEEREKKASQAGTAK